VPVRVNAVLLTKDAVFVAGGADAAFDPKAENPWAAIDWAIGGTIMVLSASDGREVGKVSLDAPTVCDGLAAASRRLYAATKSGRVYCFGRK